MDIFGLSVHHAKSGVFSANNILTPFLCGPKTHKTTEKPPKQPSSQILAAICMRLILSDSCFDADRVMFYAFSVYVYVYVYNKYIDE